MVTPEAQEEWELWKEIDRQLFALNAVTKEDRTSAVTEMDTPGKRLFETIRQWGESLVRLRQSIAK